MGALHIALPLRKSAVIFGFNPMKAHGSATHANIQIQMMAARPVASNAQSAMRPERFICTLMRKC